MVFGAEMKMVDARSSKIIWQADHIEKTHSDSMPVPVSPLGIPEAVVESSFNIREKVIAETADRLVKNSLPVFQIKILTPLSSPM